MSAPGGVDCACPPALNNRPGVIYPILYVPGVQMVPLIMRSINRETYLYYLAYRVYFDKRRLEIRLKFYTQAVLHSKLLKSRRALYHMILLRSIIFFLRGRTI